MNDDAWDIFSELCQKVVEEQNVILEVVIAGNMITMQLIPCEDEEDFDD